MKAILIAVMLLVSVPAAAQLTVSGNHLVDPQGQTVVLRGMASMGMAMVYGDRGHPGTYVPMTPARIYRSRPANRRQRESVDEQRDQAQLRRFPSASPGRLYTVEGQPYALLDTTGFPAWSPTTPYAEGDIRTSGGVRYRGTKNAWRADKSQSWNPGPYQVGDVVVSLVEAANHLYRCTKSTTVPGVAFGGHWQAYPKGITIYTEDEGLYVYEWQYAGEYGLSGTVPIDQLTPFDVNFGGSITKMWADGTMYWSWLSTDYSQAQMDANFLDWKSKVIDPVVQHAVDRGLYVVLCDFDFGPAHLPLRRARMLDFWTRIAKSQWRNHPRVLFELWNESEDVGGFAGGPGSWASQKPAIQETVNAVRASGANNIILIPPPFYSAWVGEATASPIAGTNLAYTLHQYRSQWESYPSNRAQIQQGLASGQAIVMTEWGDDTNEPDPMKNWPFFSTVLPALKDLLAPTSTGWFAWSLSQSWWPAMFGDTALMQPNPYGVSAREWLATYAGTIAAPARVTIKP